VIKLIVALDMGNAIGWSDGRLPWRIPADMKRFKELTTGHTVVMGFKTFQSLGRLDGLPNRTNYVLTRKHIREMFGVFGNDVNVISSLDYVRQLAKRDKGDIWLIGGASVYEEALATGIVDEMYITLVHEESGADVRLAIDLAAWKLFVLRSPHSWEVADLSAPEPAPGVPSCSYLHLIRNAAAS